MGFSIGNFFKAVATAIVVAAAVYYTGGAVGLTFNGATALQFLGTAAVYAGVANIAGQLTAKTPENYNLGDQLRGQLVSQRNPAADARIIYGKSRIGGTIVFMESTGSKNELMHMGIVLAGHEINNVKKVYINDVAAELIYGGGRYYVDPLSSNNLLAKVAGGVMGALLGRSTTVKKYMEFDWRVGTETQSSFSTLFAGTTGKNYQFKGLAVLGARLEYDQDIFPQGLPNLTAEVEGKKLYDPRTLTTTYSNNPALCILDYLTNTVYGLGATYDEIDDASFIEAANICDENVTLAAGGTEKRYTLNGTFLTSEMPKDVLGKMLTSCGGILNYVGGKWTIKAAKYRTPSVTLTDDDFVSEITVNTALSKRDFFNSVKGTYSEPNALYQLSSFPPVTNSIYVAQDNETIWKDIQFPFTTSVATCQRLAKIDLEKVRQQISVTVNCSMKAFSLQVGDTLYMNIDRYGWNNKIFEVTDWNFNFDNGEAGPTPVVSMTLRETASAIYDWNSGNETVIDIAPNTTLPDPYTVNAPSIEITDVLDIAAETIITKLVVTINGETNFQDNYEVEAKISTSSNWISLGKTSGNIFELYNVIDGAFYNVRARTLNTLNVRSDWTIGTHEVIGKTAPPEDVTGFSINIVGSQAYLTWNPVGDLDLSHYRIRHSRNTTNANYANAVDLIVKVPRPAVFAIAPAMTGTYFIKAIDKLGNESLNASSTVAIIEDIKGLNVIETIEESPTFGGTKTECVVTDEGYLVLDTAINFDSITGLFDDADGEFDAGGGTVSTNGTYEFANYFDLSNVYTSRITANLDVTRIDYINLFDEATGNFDDRVGLFDGAPNSYGDTNVQLYVSTTEGDPAGTPIWSEFRPFFVGDYKARAFKFKAILTSQSTESSPELRYLSVNIDMPDRVISGDDIVSGAGSYSVTFSPAFKAAPAIGIAAQNMDQGDYYQITSKSATGFTITFNNSGGSAVSRTFDYVAKGYGELATV